VWLEKRSKLFKNALEYRVDEYVTALKLIACVTDADNVKIWNHIDDLSNEIDRAFLNKILTEALYFWAGWTPDFFERLPGEITGANDTPSV
jgi:hypothetical protein